MLFIKGHNWNNLGFPEAMKNLCFPFNSSSLSHIIKTYLQMQCFFFFFLESPGFILTCLLEAQISTCFHVHILHAHFHVWCFANFLESLKRHDWVKDVDALRLLIHTVKISSESCNASQQYIQGSIPLSALSIIDFQKKALI